MTNDVPAYFGSMVFNDETMKKRLPEDVYKSLHKTIEDGRDLDRTLANCVAAAMKDWAIERGATHYTHWFQPMTGITAEKHDSFIMPAPDGSGRAIMEFSGKELIKGESDASSFPSGGLRATFEARGYTAWDPTSYAFVKDGSLYIPSVFFSYGGEVLDKKTPLLRSVEALNEQTIRILRLFGNTTVKHVYPTVGAEQEYFLVDKALFEKRIDLIYTGRTLFGAPAPRTQKLEAHYYGSIKPRIAAFMKEVDEELWKLGIFSKTKHNEAAPAQHELAPVFVSTNLAVDNNHLTMEYLKNIAANHGLVCLLHEKPFEGVNGSGKHNNWSIQTDEGDNLFKPGKTPEENLRFLTFLVAVIKAVDDYQDLLRISVATASNDRRLGANEAPPAILSMYIGEKLDTMLSAVANDTTYTEAAKRRVELGVHVLPTFSTDTSDRNRTSPFAFTGNKFEFRMLGSSLNISSPNTVLNTIVAETLRLFADELEGASDIKSSINSLIKRTYNKHKRILFSGNGYSKEWEAEAERRGLSNYRTSADALPHYSDKKNVELYERHKILTGAEMASREEILLKSYCKSVGIEAATMVEMTKRDIIPAVCKYAHELAATINQKHEVNTEIPSFCEESILRSLSENTSLAYKRLGELEKVIANEPSRTNTPTVRSRYSCDKILPAMEKLRDTVDTLETLTSSEYWPYPTYGDLMFKV